MTDQRKPMANIAPFGLRMQPDLKSRVEAAAKANNRSLNAEIVATLEREYPAQAPDYLSLLEELHDKFKTVTDAGEQDALVEAANARLGEGAPIIIFVDRNENGDIERLGADLALHWHMPKQVLMEVVERRASPRKYTALDKPKPDE